MRKFLNCSDCYAQTLEQLTEQIVVIHIHLLISQHVFVLSEAPASLQLEMDFFFLWTANDTQSEECVSSGANSPSVLVPSFHLLSVSGALCRKQAS